MGNALRYTPAGGQVEIRVENRAQHAVLRVRDNGPGVALEEQQAIFTRFYRSPATSSGEGSGLGLPIVKRIVELHFGSIGLGKGLEAKVWKCRCSCRRPSRTRRGRRPEVRTAGGHISDSLRIGRERDRLAASQPPRRPG